MAVCWQLLYTEEKMNARKVVMKIISISFSVLVILRWKIEGYTATSVPGTGRRILSMGL